MEPVVKQSLANLVGRVMDNDALSSGLSPQRHHPSQAAGGINNVMLPLEIPVLLLCVAEAVEHRVLEAKDGA